MYTTVLLYSHATCDMRHASRYTYRRSTEHDERCSPNIRTPVVLPVAPRLKYGVLRILVEVLSLPHTVTQLAFLFFSFLFVCPGFKCHALLVLCTNRSQDAGGRRESYGLSPTLAEQLTMFLRQ